MRIKNNIMIYFLIFFQLILIRNINAQWSHNPAINTPVCTSSGLQEKPVITFDDSGGAIIAWLDGRVIPMKNFASHLSSNGSELWQNDGLVLSTSSYRQFLPVICSDNAGGGIFAWEENYSIYCQKVNKPGYVIWDATGFVVDSSSSSSYKASNPAITYDGEGGAIIVWRVVNETNGNSYIFCHRVLGDGFLAWGEQAVTVQSKNGIDLKDPRIASDDSGGAVIAWCDDRSIYGQRINVNGELMWPSSGIAVCDGWETQSNPLIVSDGYQGAIVVWEDNRSGKYSKLYAQKISNSSQAVSWNVNGVEACPRLSNQIHPTIISDDHSGIIIAWADDRNGITDIFAQRIDLNGKLQWSQEGVMVCNTSNESSNPAITKDGSGGAIIAWDEAHDIYAQRLDANGNIMWRLNGIAVCTAPDSQQYPAIIHDNIGGAIIAWQDYRNGNSDIYAQRIDNWGFLGFDDTPPEIFYTPISEAAENNSIQVSAQVVDTLSGINFCTLVYKIGGHQASTSLPMATVDGMVFEATIPGTDVTYKGIQYYIFAEDNLRQASETESHSIGVKITNLTMDFVQPSGVYQMISIPLEPEYGSASSILVDDLGNYDKKIWRLFKWQQLKDDYIEFTEAGFGDFAPGKSFWLITKENKTIDSGPGTSVPVNQDFTINLIKGWNMISNPFNFNVDWANVKKTDLSGSTLWDYDGEEYFPSTQVLPWKGYFLYGWSDTSSVFIPPIESTKKLFKSNSSFFPVESLNDEEWILQLEAMCNNFRDRVNYLGISKSATVQWDNYDREEPPPPPGFYISLYFPHKNWTRYPCNYTTDFRPVFDEGTIWDFEVETNLEHAKVKISFEGIENIPESYCIYIIDNLTKFTKNLRKNCEYFYVSSESFSQRKFQLLIGKREFVDKSNNYLNLVPTQYELLQNFPNPFNSGTEIHYSLPHSERVTLKILNLLGEEIRILEDNQFKEFGSYNVVWDGLDNQNRPVAGGIYFYQLRVEDEKFLKTKKMILIK